MKPNDTCSAANFIIKRRHIVLAFLIIFVVSLTFPYSGDDWAWGSSIGLERLFSGFADYNGRYVGNLIVLLLTRSVMLRGIVIAVTLVGFALASSYFVKESPAFSFWMTLGLLTVVGADIRSQGIVWVSGFTNYAIPGVLCILYAAFCRDALLNEYKERKIPHLLPLILGFLSSLIMENITIYFIIVPIILTIYIRTKYKKWDAFQLLYVIGAGLGATLMFSNGAYWKAMSGESAYQSVSHSSLLDTAISFAQYMIFDYIAVLLIISALFVISTVYSSRSKRIIDLETACGLGSFISLVAVVIIKVFNIGDRSGIDQGLYLLFTGIIYICFFIQSLIWWINNEDARAAFCLLSMLALVLPLLFVRPFGPRNFLPVFLFLIVFTNILIVRKYNSNAIERWRMAVCIIAVILWVRLFAIYYPIQMAAYSRVQDAKSQIENGATEVVIKTLPNSDLVWTGEPDKEPWITRFKLFYDLPDDIIIITE